MNIYKIGSFFRLFSVSTVLALSVTACVKPSPRATSEGAANFFSGEITGGAIVSKTAEGVAIPNEMLFSFKTCLRDKRTDESIKGHMFSVSGGHQVVSARTDESGCLNWSERLGFNGAADAKYLMLKRQITAVGVLKGTREVSICINPWGHAELVRDCDRRPVPTEQMVPIAETEKYLKGESGKPSGLDKRLWVDDMRLNAIHSPGSADVGVVDFNLSMTPKILTKNLQGDTTPMILTDGKFKIQLLVLAKTDTGDQRCLVIGKTRQSEELTMVGGTLREETKLRVRYNITYGQLEIVAKIEAADPALRLTPFHGLWVSGDHTSLLNFKMPMMRKASFEGGSEGFDSEEYIKKEGCRDVSEGVNESEAFERIAGKITIPTLPKSALSGAKIPPTAIDADLMGKNDCIDSTDVPRLFPNDPGLVGFKPGSDFLSCMNKGLPSGVARIEQFEFGHVDVRPEPILADSETTTERTIKFRVTTLVTNPLANGAIMRDVLFRVEKSDGTYEDVRTTHQGMLIFTDRIHHVFFQPERYLLKVVRIKHASGFQRRMGIVMNPWDNEGFTFARDIRGVYKETVAQVNLIPRPKSELLLTDYSWGALSFRYEVDNLLGLTMYKQMLLKLSPRVLRYSSLIRGRMMNEPLRDGIYLMTVALQKDGLPLFGKPFQYVWVVRKLVRVNSGQINTPVDMAFRDFRVLKIRSNLLIELQTINEAKLKPEHRKKLFTDQPLDDLIQSDSGLTARTFIGPIIGYSNGFSSAMRPTDDLAETYCEHSSKAAYLIDCNELRLKQADIVKDEEIDEAKYFGSVRHLESRSAESMIADMNAIESKYRAEMQNKARLGEILKQGNLEWVSRYNEAAIRERDPSIAKQNQVLKVGSTYADFVARLSETVRSGYGNFSNYVQSNFLNKNGFDAAELDRVLLNGEPLTKDLTARFCSFFINDLFFRTSGDQPDRVDVAAMRMARTERLALAKSCLLQAGQEIESKKYAEPKEPMFVVERKFRVFKLAGGGRRKGGNLLSLSTGSDKSWGLGTSSSFSYGWSPVDLATGSAKWIAGLLPAGGPLLLGAQKFLDATGISMSFSKSDSRKTDFGGSTGTGISLAVEMRAMELKLNEYERCATIRLNGTFVSENLDRLAKAFPAEMSLQDRLDRLSRGVIYCEGVNRSKDPITLTERYYQFSQAIGEEVMNDPADLANHPYLMTIRGRSDYSRVVSVLSAQERNLKLLPEHVDIGEHPTEQLMKVFKTATPTYPGVITVDPAILQTLKIKTAGDYGNVAR